MRAIPGITAACLWATPLAAQTAGTPVRWEEAAARRILCNLVYPFVPDAPRAGGLAVLRFVVDERGRVADPAILRSSGVAAYDAAALMAVKVSNPLPRPPADRAPVSVKLPVRFAPPPASVAGPPAGKSPCGVFYGG